LPRERIAVEAQLYSLYQASLAKNKMKNDSDLIHALWSTFCGQAGLCFVTGAKLAATNKKVRDGNDVIFEFDEVNTLAFDKGRLVFQIVSRAAELNLQLSRGVDPPQQVGDFQVNLMDHLSSEVCHEDSIKLIAGSSAIMARPQQQVCAISGLDFTWNEMRGPHAPRLFLDDKEKVHLVLNCLAPAIRTGLRWSERAVSDHIGTISQSTISYAPRQKLKGTLNIKFPPYLRIVEFAQGDEDRQKEPGVCHRHLASSLADYLQLDDSLLLDKPMQDAKKQHHSLQRRQRRWLSLLRHGGAAKEVKYPRRKSRSVTRPMTRWTKRPRIDH
jgi:hypothetical protein